MTIGVPADWATRITPSGAVLLGESVACDGFYRQARVRAQTHVHSDHMDSFATSQGRQLIYALAGTRDLLIVELDGTLDVRRNFRPLDAGASVDVPGGRLWLYESGHMLGAAQVVFEREDGYRTAYSGDFSWPLQLVPEVDELVVDSTYGDPSAVRRYTQADAEEAFAERIATWTRQGPVYVRAYRGTLERALVIMAEHCDFPVLASRRQMRDAEVHRRHGFGIGELVPVDSDEAKVLRSEGRYVELRGMGDPVPTDLGVGFAVTLSAYHATHMHPVQEFSERSCTIALSNHADFEGTVEYVRASNARRVLTDNVRGRRGVVLALELRQRLGVETHAATPDSAAVREWGL